MILDDSKDKYDDVIDEEKLGCAEVGKLSRYNILVERLESQWNNEKSYLQLRKDEKVTFEDIMPNMKTLMNHNLLTQTDNKHMECSEQISTFINRVIEDSKQNTL